MIEQGFVAREQWALEALYVQHGSTFYSAAFSVLRNAEEAQDCVHDVLLRLWRRPNTYAPGKGSLKAFVAVCVRNEAVSRVRLRGREPELQRRLAAQTGPENFEPFDHVEHNRLVQALGILPPPQRQVVILSYFQHRTLREIAEQTGDPIGTIKSRLSSALQRLRDALSGAPVHD